LTGTAPGTNYGRLQSSSTLNLSGGLAITLALTNGYLPANNDTFVLVSAGTRNGAFSSFSYPSNVVTMVLSNSPTTVVARATGVTVPPPVLLTLSYLARTCCSLGPRFPTSPTASNPILTWQQRTGTLSAAM
jgi:hypothetical protein